MYVCMYVCLYVCVCVCMHGDLKALSILLCLCTDEYPLTVVGSCQYHGWRSKVRLSDYMRCVVCLDLSGHTTSPCVLSLCKTLFAFFGMLLVVVGYHLVLDGPHVLRCVLSNIRCYMQYMYVSIYLWLRGRVNIMVGDRRYAFLTT